MPETQAVLALARRLDPADLKVFLVELRQAEVEAFTRLNPAPVAASEPKREDPRDLLTVKQAAKLLGKSVKWVYANWKSLPWTRIGNGEKKQALGFRRGHLEEYIAQHSSRP